MKWFDIEWLEKKCPGCKYYIFFGLRSNGKTTSILRKIVKNFFKNGKCGAILRRWKEDFKGKRAASLFDTLISDANGHNHIKELSKGKYDRVTYLSGRWFMAYYDEELEQVVFSDIRFLIQYVIS
jgi:phage FluMu protein Com